MLENNEGPGPRAVITISGIPRDADPTRMMRVIDDVAEIACERMDNVEVGMATNAPDETMGSMMSPEDMKTMYEGSAALGVNFPLLMKAQVAGQLVMAATMMLEDQNAEKQWESKSEEEKEAIIEHNRARSEHWDQVALKEMQDKRTNEIRQVFDIANTWATEPELTPMERCHGVAHDVYKLYGADAKPIRWDSDKEVIPPIIQQAYPINAGQAYAQHYDTHLSDQIKSRTLRAAKDLFGS
jgi:Ni/Co efflux regulator RcnB